MKTGILVGLVVYLVATSCSGQKTDKATPTIINKIAELPEYKQAERAIDSLKTKGTDVKIQIAVLPAEILRNDSLSIAFIEANYGFDQEELYEVAFEKKTQKIVSVKAVHPIRGSFLDEPIQKVK